MRANRPSAIPGGTLACLLAALAGAFACTTGADPVAVHLVREEIESPGPETTAYTRSLDAALARAAARPDQAETILAGALALPVPAGFFGVPRGRLEVAHELCKTWTTDPRQAARAVEILRPMLAPERTLPLAPATARALVLLGDAAVSAGQADLAAQSYLRAIRVMEVLQEEAMP